MDKYAKLKNDKDWLNNNLSKADKRLEEAFQVYLRVVETGNYWYDNLHWLQKRFPEAVYQDVVGLCKGADRSEYVEEQNYSLNAGRYVGVEIEDDKISHEGFLELMGNKNERLKILFLEANDMEAKIFTELKNILG